MKDLASPPQKDRPEVIQLESGSVTLLTLDQMKAAVQAGEAEAIRLRETAATLGLEAGDRLAEAGRLLVSSPSAWAPDPVSRDLLRRAQDLSTRIEADQTRLKALSEQSHHGLAGLVGRVGESVEKNQLQADMARQQPMLRTALMEIAQSAPAVTFEQADELRGQARSLQEEARKVTEAADGQSQVAHVREVEIKQRQEAMRAVGFDSLYAAANLAAHGAPPVQTPLITKRGEEASFAVPATLARHKTKVTFRGGSQGFSIPIGHTGIRYRVGSFHGQPVAQDYVAKIDAGTLVVTNQRIAFIGAQRSVSYQLDKVVHIETYTDGMAIFKEGRETGDIFLCGSPAQFLLYLNYWLGKRSGG